MHHGPEDSSQERVGAGPEPEGRQRREGEAAEGLRDREAKLHGRGPGDLGPGGGEGRKFAGKAVKEANDEPRYVAWLLGHQAENDKLQNIMVFAERLELEKHRPKGMSSGSMPMTEDEKATCIEIEATNGDTTYQRAMVPIIVESIRVLKLQVEQLEQAAMSHQQTILQAMKQIAGARRRFGCSLPEFDSSSQPKFSTRSFRRSESGPQQITL